MKGPFDVAGAIDWKGRSPFQLRGPSLVGVPPAHDDPLIVTDASGTPKVMGVPLTPFNVPVADLARNTAPNAAQQNAPAVAQYAPGNYGDAIAIPIVFTGAGNVIALRRPNQTRISLLIQNLSVVGQVFYAFDRNADNVSCVAIGAGGNRLFDTTVPQGDLNIFSTGAGTVIVEYINQDISNPRN